MRRLLATSALVVLVAIAATPTAVAQDNGYSGGWVNPTPTATREGKPLAYLDAEQLLTGQVSHPNGIRNVSGVLVVDDDNTSDACAPHLDPAIAVEQNGTAASFRLAATLPCNLVYELRATAQANDSGGLTSSQPPSFAMPLLVAMAVPPAPVAQVDAVLEIDGDDRYVTLTWPEGAEPDLLGYVVTRVTAGEAEMLGQVDAGKRTRFIDSEPPKGATSRYEITAVRNGPDDEVEQVAAAPTGVDVDVPGRSAGADDEASGGSGGDAPREPADPQLAGDAAPAESRGRPDPGSLSSVSFRGVQGRPSPPTTLDTGYSETIAYPERADDGQVALPAGDSAVVALYDETLTGSPWSNKETMSFIAGGLAVLVGASVVLTITRRAARPAY